MPDALFKSLGTDDVIEFPGLEARLVDLGDFTGGHIVTEPGWRWSTAKTIEVVTRNMEAVGAA